MDRAPQEAWPVERLAEISAVTPAHFAREFRKAFGLPPHRYLLTRRVERAIALLRDTDLPITQIALDTGWNSLGTFSRVFKDITNTSPSALRVCERRHGDEHGHGHGHAQVPECVVRAAQRPDLKTAVSEKRRAEAAPTMAPLSTETP